MRTAAEPDECDGDEGKDRVEEYMEYESWPAVVVTPVAGGSQTELARAGAGLAKLRLAGGFDGPDSFCALRHMLRDKALVSRWAVQAGLAYEQMLEVLDTASDFLADPTCIDTMLQD